jgi:hypothetical protein
MNEVQVFFMGMVMWWLAAPGPFVLIPDLAGRAVPHAAVIEATPASFVDGVCPGGFTTGDDGDCEFALNGAGATGGVSISLVTTAIPQAGASSYCTVPKIQRFTSYALRGEFTPPLGSGNAAWMMAEGGRAVSGVQTCMNTPPGNCPRFVRWSVPATETQPVRLILANRKDGAPPIEARLKAGAQVRISNSPTALLSTDAAHPRMSGAEDWCMYFEMVAGPRGLRPGCPGAPPIPAQCEPLAAEPDADVVSAESRSMETRSMSHRVAYRFTTIACSNSQYP